MRAGKESRDELNSKPGLLERLETIRSQGASANIDGTLGKSWQTTMRVLGCAVSVEHDMAE